MGQPTTAEELEEWFNSGDRTLKSLGFSNEEVNYFESIAFSTPT